MKSVQGLLGVLEGSYYHFMALATESIYLLNPPWLEVAASYCFRINSSGQGGERQRWRLRTCKRPGTKTGTGTARADDGLSSSEYGGGTIPFFRSVLPASRQ